MWASSLPSFHQTARSFQTDFNFVQARPQKQQEPSPNHGCLSPGQATEMCRHCGRCESLISSRIGSLLLTMPLQSPRHQFAAQSEGHEMCLRQFTTMRKTRQGRRVLNMPAHSWRSMISNQVNGIQSAHRSRVLLSRNEQFRTFDQMS